MDKQENTKHFTRESNFSIVLLAVLFLYMYALNFLMPLHRDDYEYSLVWGTLEKITTWPQVFQSLHIHYLQHGGRMVDFFVLDSFLVLGKQWFNPFNAFLFVALIVLIYWHSQRKITFAFNPYILLLIIVFCWLCLPHFGLANIWMTGACVYLMPAVLILAFLLPYHFYYLEKPLLPNGFLAAIGMFFAGITAAWTIENTAATMNIIIVFFLAAAYRKHSLTKWMLTGFLGAVLGFLLLVVAPGNYIRYADTKTPFGYHISNLFAAGGEILLYILPIVLFIILVWRVLVTDYARQRGFYALDISNETDNSSRGSIIRLTILFLMLFSYLTQSFVSKWIAGLIYDNVAVRLGIATPHLQEQFFNTMSGLEEVVIYLLSISEIFNYTFRKLTLSKTKIRSMLDTVGRQDILRAYPGCNLAAAAIALSIINHVIMIGSPTFPGRAGFGSVVLMIIAAVSFFTIPAIYNFFLTTPRKKYLAIFCGIVFIPMALLVLQQYTVIYRTNMQRMAYVETMANEGATYLELDPLPFSHPVLRHVYFIELNNSVSKLGFCRYYGLKNVIVKPN